MAMFGRPNIYKSLADDFVFVFHVRCKENKLLDTFTLDHADADFIARLPVWKICPRFSEQLDFIVNNLVHPDDRKVFYDRTRREVVLRKLDEARSYFVDFRLIVDGHPKYYTQKFAALRDKGGRLDGFVTGLMDVDQIVRSERLDATERMRRAMSFFSENYISAYRRNLDDDTFSIIAATKHLRSEYGSDMFFTDSFNRYCEREVCEGDRKLMKSAGSIAGVRERLQGRPYFTVRYRDIGSGTPKWWTMRVNRIEGNPDEVIIAFNDTDEDVRRDIDRETKIATARESSGAIDRILRALKSGSPLADPTQFLEIIRERFNAECCCFVRYDFTAGLVCIDKGCGVVKGLPPTETPWAADIRAFEDQLMELATAGFSELDAAQCADFFAKCATTDHAPTFLNIRHHVATSVLVRGRMRGALNIDFLDDRPLSEMERGNLRSLADILGSAIERSEVYASLEKAQKIAASENEFITTVVNTIPIPCFVKDADDDFRYIRCNAAFSRRVGLPKEEIVGYTDWDLFDAKSIAHIRSRDFAAMESDEPISYTDNFAKLQAGADRDAIHWKRKMTGPDGHTLILCVIADLGQ